jgi:hypothetical protein
MAFAAGSASALSVVHESNNVVCGTVAETIGVMPEIQTTNEICPIRGTTTDFEWGGAFGTMFVCDVTLEGDISGTGKIEGNYTTADCPGNESVNMTVTPCTASGQRHVEAQLSTETTGRLDLCWISSGLTNTCLNVLFTITEVAHVYTLSFNHVNKCSNGVTSFQGNIVQVIDAAHPKIEIKD